MSFSIIRPDKLPILRENGSILNQALTMTRKMIEDFVDRDISVSELDADEYCRSVIESRGAIPSCLNYNGFPNSVCISVNDTLVHGIPSSRLFKKGDIVSLDCAVYKNNYHVDKAITFCLGKPTLPQYTLIEAAQNSLDYSINKARVGNTIGDIAYETFSVAKHFGFRVCKEFVGHGVGLAFHMEPAVPNIGDRRTGIKIPEGLCIAIEPMLFSGENEIVTLEDKWTVKAKDGCITAHCEDTVYVTNNGPIIVTREPF